MSDAAVELEVQLPVPPTVDEVTRHWSAIARFINETVVDNSFCDGFIRMREDSGKDLSLSPYPWNSPQQLAFLSLPTLEAFYGGAAGGGKSIALLLSALQYVHVPGYNAILLRKTFADLVKPDALIPLSFQVLKGTPAQWNGSRHEWAFPSGATLTFGYCDAENDKFIYQGAQYQFIGFDELTQFTMTQYLYLISRLRRRANVNVLLRARAASNPGGLGHDWVKQRFVVEENNERPFIPSKLEDNPDLDKESYNQSLQLLDLVTRSQLRHGDWSIRPEGNMFKRIWFANKILDREPNDVVRWRRHWDLAATEPEPGKDPDWVSGVKVGLRVNGTYVIADVRRARVTPAQVEDLVKTTAAIDGRACEIGLEEEGGASGKLVVDYYQRIVLLGYAVHGERPNGDKVTRAQPFSAAVEHGHVSLVRGPWINQYLDELCAFPLVDHDDQVDGTTGAFNAISSKMGHGQTMKVPSGMGRTVR